LKRGEVVLVKDGAGGCALKRIIGLPRETVRLSRGYIYINGKMLREPYLPPYTFTHPDPNKNQSAFALGTGCYFVLGDNRLYSHDSRHYGPVVLGQIVSLVEQGATLRPEFAAIELPVHGRQARHRVEPK
jgi:signal peptidase I